MIGKESLSYHLLRTYCASGRILKASHMLTDLIVTVFL